MKKLLLLITLLIPAISGAQEKTIIQKEINGIPSVYTALTARENGENDIVLHLLLPNSTDEAYFAAGENEINDLRFYFISLLAKYDEWAKVWHKSGLKDFRKDMDVPARGFHYHWLQHKKEKYGWQVMPIERDNYDLSFITPTFVAHKGWAPFIHFMVWPPDPDGEKELQTGLITRKDLRNLIEWCDYNRVLREHIKHQPKYTQEQLDNMFK